MKEATQCFCKGGNKMNHVLSHFFEGLTKEPINQRTGTEIQHTH